MYSGSQVVVGQVSGQYEAKKERMAQYLALVKEEMKHFEGCVITRIERGKNLRADALAKMASNPEGRHSMSIEYQDRPSVDRHVLTL